MTKSKTPPEMLERFKQGLQRQWEQCGADLLISHAEYGDKRRGGGKGLSKYQEPLGYMLRNDVFDAAADLYVGQLCTETDSQALHDAWFGMTKAERERLKKEAFPHSIYGY